MTPRRHGTTAPRDRRQSPRKAAAIVDHFVATMLPLLPEKVIDRGET